MVGEHVLGRRRAFRPGLLLVYDDKPKTQYVSRAVQEHMGSIPDALYWCSIYLLGEWAAALQKVVACSLQT